MKESYIKRGIDVVTRRDYAIVDLFLRKRIRQFNEGSLETSEVLKTTLKVRVH